MVVHGSTHVRCGRFSFDWFFKSKSKSHLYFKKKEFFGGQFRILVGWLVHHFFFLLLNTQIIDIISEPANQNPISLLSMLIFIAIIDDEMSFVRMCM